ncbi:MAG: response regulator [Candidatus Promineifilaceae bacterium]
MPKLNAYSSQTKTQTVNVLCVEDELPIREAITDLLQMSIDQFEVNVVPAGNGVEGLSCLRELIPDLIISDVSMPKMNGFTFLSELRKEQQWAQIPFIFLTAHGSPDAVRQGREQGIEQFITKPFDPADFVSRIETQLLRALVERDVSEEAFQTIQREVAHILQHEFRTPLTFVMAYFDFLLTSASEGPEPEPEEVTENLDGIMTGDRRLTKLVENLIRTVDLRAGVVTRQIEREAAPIYNLSPLLKQLGEQFKTQAEAVNATLHLSVPDNLPQVYGVEQTICEMLERLVDNALKLFAYKRVGARHVWVSAETTSNKTVRFTVRDNGIGFPHHLRETIFEAFYQYNRKSLEQQGPGVGLTIVKGLVEAHGGYIEARSQSSKGASFIIDLPIYNGDPATALRPLSADIDRKVTILVVEDEPAVLSNIEILLTVASAPYEYDVITATNGKEALAVMQKTVPDIILSDVLMPKLDGYGFLKRVRANPAWLHLPVIFLTAKGAATDESLGRKLGVDDYVTKPYNADYLLNIVETRLLRHFQKKQAELHKFDALRERVLRSINRSILQSLISIRNHTNSVRQMLTVPDIAEHTTDIRHILSQMKADTDKLAQIIDSIMALTDLRSGVAAKSFKKRAQMIESMGSIVNSATETVLASDKYHFSAETAKISLSPTPHMPPIRGEKRTLELAFANLLEFNLLYSSDACLKLSVKENGETIQVCIVVGESLFSAEENESLQTLLSLPDLTTAQVDDSWIPFIIAKEYISIHQATIRFIFDEANETHKFLIDMPTFDPFA